MVEFICIHSPRILSPFNDRRIIWWSKCARNDPPSCFPQLGFHARAKRVFVLSRFLSSGFDFFLFYCCWPKPPIVRPDYSHINIRHNNAMRPPARPWQTAKHLDLPTTKIILKFIIFVSCFLGRFFSDVYSSDLLGRLCVGCVGKDLRKLWTWNEGGSVKEAEVGWRTWSQGVYAQSTESRLTEFRLAECHMPFKTNGCLAERLIGLEWTNISQTIKNR